MPLPARPVLLTLGALGVLVTLIIALPWLSPARGVERSFDHLLEAIEDNDAAKLERLFGADYGPSLGHDRAATLRLAAEIRGQFATCTVCREQSELSLDPSKQSATTRALIRFRGQGSSVARAIVEVSAATPTPAVFKWRRNSWKPWDWRLVGIDHPDAARALARFERQAAALGL
ncbi:hypothetical protein EBZ70_07885 [bacterium]|nr:hypothetical protein [bacterium]